MNIIDSSVELGKAVRYALMHKADPVVLKHIEDESARIWEELRKKHDLTNVAAELIWEVRDE